MKFKKIFLLAIIFFSIYSVSYAYDSPTSYTSITSYPNNNVCTVASGDSTCYLTIFGDGVKITVTNSNLTYNFNGGSLGTFLPDSSPTGNFKLSPAQSPANFYLNDVYNPPALTVNAICALNTSWDGTKCAPIPMGTLSSSSVNNFCTIARFGNSCSITLSGDVTNPLSSPYLFDINNPSGVSIANGSAPANSSGTTIQTTYNLPYGSYQNFTLVGYYDGLQMANLFMSATCATGDAWDSNTNMCIVDPVIDGTTDSAIVEVTTTPVVVTTGVSNITTTTATFNGEVTSENGATVTARGFVWGTSPSPTRENNLGISINGSGIGTFTNDITGLTPGTTYYVSAYAINTVGTEYGNDISFTTLAMAMSGTLSPPFPTCTIALGASSCDKILTWSITNPVGNTTAITANGDADINVSSSNTPSYQTGTQSVNVPGSATVPMAAKTFYLYNNGVKLFTVSVVPSCISGSWTGTVCATIPTITTTPASSITQTTATSGGNVTASGGSAVTTRGVVWSTSPSPTIALPTKTSNGTGTGIFTSSLTGLTPGTTYYVRAYATNSVGTGYGGEITFNTSSSYTVTVNPTNYTIIANSGAEVSPIFSTTVPSYSACSLLNNFKDPFPDYYNNFYPTDSFVDYPAFNTPGLYGYYIECHNADFSKSAESSMFTVTVVATSGTLTTSSSTCTIASGASSCSSPITLTYSVTNPFGASSVTTNVPIDNTTISTSSTYPATKSVTIPYPSQTFWLYNNNNDLVVPPVTVTASCISGTVWNTIDQKCMPITIDTLTASPTGVTFGGSSNISWTTTNATTCYLSTSDHNLVSGTSNTGWNTGALSSPQTFTLSCTGPNNSSASKSVTVSILSMSVTASPLTYNVATGANIPFTYTPTVSSGSIDCRLLDYTGVKDFDGVGLTDWASNTKDIVNTINYNSPSNGGIYGYFVQCRSASNTSIKAISSLITVNAIQVSVTATTPYDNVYPGAEVSFDYTTSMIPSGVGSTECLLQDNLKADITPYSTVNPIKYKVVNGIGSYGYYVKCRNTEVVTAVATSNMIIVNTACTGGTWNGSSCLVMLGTLTPHNCTLTAGQDTCNATLDWSITNPIGTPTAITAGGDPDINVTSTLATPQSGTVDVTVGTTPKTFYLYNDGTELASASIAATTGTLSSTGCTIPAGQSSCPSLITWDTINPSYGITSVVKDITKGVTVTTAPSGTDFPYPISSGTTYFSLMHGTAPLASSHATASCGILQHPDSNGICIINSPDINNTTFIANPATVFKGKSSTLTWTSTVATSCSINDITDPKNSISIVQSGPPNGSKVVDNLQKTTLYSLVCINSTGSNPPNNQPVKVVNVTVKEN